MATGISIGEVDNILQSEDIQGTEKIPVSSGDTQPQVVTAGGLKDYVLEDVGTALGGKQDVISDLSTIRNGAALGATALQSFTETDPTVPSWAKQSSKPSYNYSEITGKPELSAVATSGSYNDLNNKPNIPSEQIQSDWNQSNTSAKDYIKNKPTIPVLPALADVATSGDYEDLVNTPTIPDVPEWAMASTKPSYTVSEIDGAQEELVSGTNIKTINGESVLGSGNISVSSGTGGDANVIESITFNGDTVPVDGSKNAAITETDPTVPSWAKAANKPSYTAAEVGALPDTTVIPAAQVNSDWNASSGVAQILNKPTIPTVPTALSSFTDDLGSSPTHTHSQYLTSESEPAFTGSAAYGISSSDITNWNGKTSNVGTITGITMNGASKGTSGVVDLGTVITSHQDISGKENTSNKVTSLSASSTDTQYPSAKCVWDLVGDIETILASI